MITEWSRELYFVTFRDKILSISHPMGQMTRSFFSYLVNLQSKKAHAYKKVGDRLQSTLLPNTFLWASLALAHKKVGDRLQSTLLPHTFL